MTTLGNKNDSTVTLEDLENAWAEAEAELAGDATEAATSDAPTNDDSGSTEHVAATEEGSDEDVDLLADLDDDADEGTGGEQSDTDSQTFTIDGEPVTLKELREGYLRRKDYTQKTQDLSAQREELEKARTLYEAMRDNPVETLNQLQAAVRQGRVPVQETPAQKEEAKDIDALVAAKVQEYFQNDPEIQNVRTAAEQRTLDEAFASIEKDFDLPKPLSSADREKVVAKAEELGITDPSGYGVIFGGLLQQAQARRARIEDAAKAAPTKGRRSSDGDHDAEEEEIEDFWGAAMAAARELGMEELLK